MPFLLNWRLWVLVALSAALVASHVIAYRKGANHVRTEWAAARSLAESESRRIEQRRQSMVDAATRSAVERENRLRRAAAAASGELARLRDTLNTPRDTTPQSCAAETERAATLGKLLLESGELLTELAAKADGHASDVKTLLDGWPK